MKKEGKEQKGEEEEEEEEEEAAEEEEAKYINFDVKDKIKSYEFSTPRASPFGELPKNFHL